MRTYLRQCTLLLTLVSIATGCPSSARSAEFTTYIHERLLDKIATQVPAPNWQGHFTLAYVVDFTWNTVLKDINFEITSDGIAFSANLITTVPWLGGQLRFSQPVTGTAYMLFDESTSQMRFGTTHADLPIFVTIPLIGRFKIFTLGSDLPYEMTYPITPRFSLRAGDTTRVGIQVYDLARHYESNRVRVTGKTRIW